MHPRIPIFLPFAALIVFSGCHPATPLPTTRKTPPAAIPAIAAMIPTLAAAPSPSGPAYPILPSTEPTLVRKTIDGIGFEGVSFDSRTHRLAVVDQPGGPGSEYETASEVARRQHALLAINAGFFTPEGKPLGLLVSEGKAAGAWNSASSLGNGIFKQASNGTGSISRRSSRAAAASNATQLLQAGPLLLENGNQIHGLDGSKTALRSIILTDGGQRWWIGKTSPCTLAALGSALALASPTPWKIRNALNLDGGRSTDLFISSAIPGGPVNRRGFLNRPVRNFLILTAR